MELLMQTVSIEVPISSEDPEVVVRVLRAVADVLAGPAQGDAPDAAKTTPEPSPFVGVGGEQSLRGLIARITPKARWLVRQIASDNLAEGESRGRTIRERAGGVNEGTLGGWVWSISSATRKLGFAKPYDTDYEERADGWQVIYRMPSEVAEAVVRMTDEEGTLRS
jgi:hypothetical protein